ncbi:MAG: SH3 domain-containing protein [Synergistaceae bacterium]|nr:SH3 domain-containing protein [Synergistaceae bacterium]
MKKLKSRFLRVSVMWIAIASFVMPFNNPPTAVAEVPPIVGAVLYFFGGVAMQVLGNLITDAINSPQPPSPEPIIQPQGQRNTVQPQPNNPPPPPPQIGYITGSNVFLRPDLSRREGPFLQNGYQVTILGSKDTPDGKWLNVNYNGKIGWVFAQYVSFAPAPQNSKNSVPRPKPEGIVVVVKGSQQVDSTTINSVRSAIISQLHEKGLKVVDGRNGYRAQLTVQIGIKTRSDRYKFYGATVSITVNIKESNGTILYDDTVSSKEEAGFSEDEAIQNAVEAVSELTMDKMKNTRRF